jgi:manganese-dependent inorganic pyrophosphatase
MQDIIHVIGHKNPDTDSICSAIGLAYLKQAMNSPAKACTLGQLNRESAFVMDRFNLPTPESISNVYTQVSNMELSSPASIGPTASILSAYTKMTKESVKTLCIADERNHVLGLITMKDIAMSLIGGDFYRLNTSMENLLENLMGEKLSGTRTEVSGRIRVMAYNFDSLKIAMDQDSIIIVGDRYDVLMYAIMTGVQLIILTGGRKPPQEIHEFADKQDVCILSTPMDTYTTAKLINQTNYISTILKPNDIVCFYPHDYLGDVREEVLRTSFRNYPVLGEHNQLIGFINRRHVLNPGRKKVILVDHNEYAQSADGIHEAEILEIVDHHKLGDITTSYPISFRNMPVGSTCTIVATMFFEQNILIPDAIAGGLLSGILSDTMFLRSPTTSELDSTVVTRLNNQLELDIPTYYQEMLRAGTSLEGLTEEKVFNRDLKIFELDRHKLCISQVFTLDVENVFLRKQEFLTFIQAIHRQNNHFLTLLLVTDINQEGSYLLFECEQKSLISNAFQVANQQGVFCPSLVSRKKQVIPKLIETIHML